MGSGTPHPHGRSPIPMPGGNRPNPQGEREVFDRRLRVVPVLVIAAGVLALAIAFGSQHLGGLAPCILCVYQRWPYGVAILLGAAGLLVRDRPALLGPVLAAAGLAFLASAGIGAFHVGVEQHWWQGTAECGATIDTSLSLEELKAKLLAAPVVRCDEVAWSLFGISMAGYNFLYASACGLLTLWAAMRIVARRPR